MACNSFSQTQPSVLISYYSKSGMTKSMAEAVAVGVGAVDGVRVVLIALDEVSNEEVLNASAIILGSPVYNANVAPQVKEFINSWPYEGRPLKGKIGAIFVTGGGFTIGVEAVMISIIRSMMIHGMIIVEGAETEAAFGASAITGEGEFEGKEINEVFLRKKEGLGRRVGSIVLNLN